MHLKLGKVLTFEHVFLLTLSITGSFQGIAVYTCICYGCLCMPICTINESVVYLCMSTLYYP